MNNRALFLRHLAQTSPAPLALEISRAEGSYLYGPDGRRWLDLIAGISVCHLGHAHPAVVEAIRKQAGDYLHVMVYGELVQSPQVQYAAALAGSLPESLSTVYFTGSGSEATEGAIKLARRITGRTDLLGATRSYHGSTTGALSLMGDEYWRNAFRPLMPGARSEPYGSQALLDAIGSDTAAVIVEPVQAEAGVITPPDGWLQALRRRCDETGALLVFDEIQTGFGRTGTLWGMDRSGVVPDILLLGKALGGGMPLGAFVSGYEQMRQLTDAPVLGHITTFGGHPVCCAAGLAAFRVLQDEKIADGVQERERRFLSRLRHPSIRAVRSAGLLMAVQLGSAEAVLRVLTACLEQRLFSDWFLFAPDCIRIAPPLNLSMEEIDEACDILLRCLDEAEKH